MSAPLKPLVLKMLQGTAKPGKINPNQPMPEEGTPKMPSDLTPAEREVWNRLVVELRGLHVLTKHDGPALKMLAVTYARWEQLVNVLRTEGHTFKNGSMVRARPEVVMERRAMEKILVMCGRFGLTPSDRQKVSTAPNKKREPMDEFRAPRGMSEFAARR